MAAAIGYVSPALRESLSRGWGMLGGITGSGAIGLPAIPWTEVLLSPIGAAAAVGLTMALVLAPLAIYLTRE